MSVFDEQLWTVQELAGFLKIRPTTVYAHLKDWPHMQTTAAGIIRFRETHVETILTLMTKQPTPPEPPTTTRNIGTNRSRRTR